MQNIYRHLLTGSLMELKKKRDHASVLYMLDELGQRIADGRTVTGGIYYKVALCKNENLELIK